MRKASIRLKCRKSRGFHCGIKSIIVFCIYNHVLNTQFLANLSHCSFGINSRALSGYFEWWSHKHKSSACRNSTLWSHGSNKLKLESSCRLWKMAETSVYKWKWCRGLTAAAICAGLGVNLQAWREWVLQEVHVEVVLTLHCFLYAQLKDVGEVAGGIKPQVHYRISNAEWENKREKTQLEYVIQTHPG